MTDDQLRAMARQVHLSMPGMRVSDGEYWCKDIRFGIADAIDSNAVAIMREEMAKCPKCGSDDTLACCCECGVYWGKDGIREPVQITAAIYDPADDPTKSFVATTEGQ